MNRLKSTYTEESTIIELHSDCVVEENLCQLTVSKRKGPKSQITRSVGDRSKSIFNGFDHLMNHKFTKAVWMFLSNNSLSQISDVLAIILVSDYLIIFFV